VQTLPVRSRAGTPAGRLDFLDGLRGVAVGLVLLQHVGELTVPAIGSLTSSAVQLGQFGVMVFFLCSGFIIPASLERGRREPGRRAALRAFWISRVFRLYPLYWLSLAGAALLVALDRYVPEQSLSAGDWLANAAMLQLPAGAPHALGLYWTLAFELIFYVAVSTLFVLGWHRRSVVLSLSASAGCLAAAVLSGPLLDRPAPLGLFCLATMFLGTVFHRWHAGELGLRTLACCVVTSLAAGAAMLWSTAGDPAAPSVGVVPMLTAWLGAHAVFCAGLALRHRSVPRWLRRLGTISYSVYLVQALVLIAVPALPWPLVTAAVWTAVVVVASELTYRFVEQPAVRLGRQLSDGRRVAAESKVLVHPTRTVERPIRTTAGTRRLAV
jgi:peptidoglycan/LPS O-acetylase OafA/YrhL